MDGHPSEAARGAGSAVLGEVSGRRVLVVDLGPAGRTGAEAWLGRVRAAVAAAADLQASAGRSGPALAMALYAAAHRSAGGGSAPPDRAQGPSGGAIAEPSLVASVGDAVRRGVPTAARATVSARAPLRPGITEAQVGGPFGRGLAAHADALVLLGRAEEPRVVRVLAGGTVELGAAPAELLGLGAAGRAQALRRGSASAHTVATGPGAQAGLPFANLASFDGADPEAAPSVVGRGGLGAALASAGVVALTVEEAPLNTGAAPGAGDPGGDLEAALVRSPRLLTRAAGGTLELAASRATDLEVAGARRKHGCAGCPTPCGWTFEVDRGGAKVGGRFSALQGFAGHGDPLELLERCNDLGIDARAVAALMGRHPEVGPDAFFAGLLDPASEAHAAAMDPGPLSAAGATFARGDLAAEVGQALAVRGPEPLRSLSILGLDGARAEQVVAPLPWSGDRERDAGTLAFWHECVAAAVDVWGFCSFSAAGLLADGVMGLAELAEALGLEAADDVPAAAGFLRAGADHLALHRELLAGELEIPAELAERHPAAVEAYLAARDADLGGASFPGRPGGEATRGGVPSGMGAAGDPAAGGSPLTVLARGPLGSRLSGHPGHRRRGPETRSAVEGVRIEVHVPTEGWTGPELLAALAAACPSAAPWLLDPAGRPLPAVLEVETPAGAGGGGDGGGRRHRPGAVVELVLAIPGG
jgi:hypothetical protein